MSINKYISPFIITLVFFLTINSSFGQEAKVDFDRNKSKRISLSEFHRRVDRATKLLKTKELSAISDNDHINIMMCLNTILIGNLPDSDKRVNDIRYKKLKAISHKLQAKPVSKSGL